jgi:translation initiation factor IF-2
MNFKAALGKTEQKETPTVVLTEKPVHEVTAPSVVETTIEVPSQHVSTTTTTDLPQEKVENFSTITDEPKIASGLSDNIVQNSSNQHQYGENRRRNNNNNRGGRGNYNNNNNNYNNNNNTRQQYSQPATQQASFQSLAGGHTNYGAATATTVTAPTPQVNNYYPAEMINVSG